MLFRSLQLLTVFLSQPCTSLNFFQLFVIFVGEGRETLTHHQVAKSSISFIQKVTARTESWCVASVLAVRSLPQSARRNSVSTPSVMKPSRAYITPNLPHSWAINEYVRPSLAMVAAVCLFSSLDLLLRSNQSSIYSLACHRSPSASPSVFPRR